MEIEISKVKKEEDQEVLSCSFLGKSIPSHLPGFVFMVSGLQLSDAVLQTVEKAGILLVPYLVWLTYVGYLNFMISILN